ncbi:hypothetical protein [Roseovarius pelagicus]|uniref:Uncharacterized protein n=1 Tax=Roseovarius pelagicus TaxID=2980108 RepID=A0ABY6DBH9_9RHOB|nr:hypothetical protein [Roseovarius pelagicus]UXX83504.1 hypothetical protein N7U68_02135 [Roseovarius pelagicus]
MTQAKQNEGALALVFIEFTMISVFVGVFNSSWVWGGLTFFVSLLLLCTEHASKAIPPLATIAWGYFGFTIANYFGGTSAGIVVGLIIAAMAYGLHMQAIEGIADQNFQDADENKTAVSKSRFKGNAGLTDLEQERSLRDAFRNNDIAAPRSTALVEGRSITLSVFCIGLSAMVFWWWYEPDPTRQFSASSLQTWSALSDAERDIFRMMPVDLRERANRLQEHDRGYLITEWDRRRKMSCPFGALTVEKSRVLYGLRRCRSKDERDLANFALDIMLSN